VYWLFAVSIIIRYAANGLIVVCRLKLELTCESQTDGNMGDTLRPLGLEVKK
jgi:hypothetical protein